MSRRWLDIDPELRGEMKRNSFACRWLSKLGRDYVIYRENTEKEEEGSWMALGNFDIQNSNGGRGIWKGNSKWWAREVRRKSAKCRVEKKRGVWQEREEMSKVCRWSSNMRWEHLLDMWTWSSLMAVPESSCMGGLWVGVGWKNTKTALLRMFATKRSSVSQPLSHYCPLRSLFRHFSLIAPIPWNFKPQVHCVSVYVLYVCCYWYIKWVQYIFTSWKISFTWYHPCWEYSVLA